jgi:long-chain fatty acid transport protein
MRRYAVRSSALALVALALLAPRANAQGFGVYEHDACTMGRAATGVAKPCNASAIFYNPAGILNPGGSRWNLAVGGTIISPSFTFTDSLTGAKTTGPTNHIPVPNLYITRQHRAGGHDWAFGIGVFAPYGLVSEWPITFSGRFLGYRSEIKSLYIQPTAALRVNRWLQLGAGFDYIWTHVDLKQRVDLSSQLANATTTFGQLGIPAGTDFADANLVGSAYSAGGHFGVILTPTSKLSLGARYLMRVRANVQGDATFSQIMTGITLPPGNPIAPANTPLDSVLAPQFRGAGKLQKQHVSTFVAQPDQLVLGAAYAVTPQLTALVDYQWVNWSQFDSLQITFLNLPATTQYEDYLNTNGWRFGLQYEGNGFVLRGGYLKHDGAAPGQTVTPLLPEGARTEFTLGGGIKVGAHGHLDIAYQHITQQDRRGRVVSAPRGSTANNTGIYSGSASLLGASLTWGW